MVIVGIAAAFDLSPGPVVSVRCPACRKLATFEGLGTDLSLSFNQRRSLTAGQRRCPGPQCRAHLFFIEGPDGLTTYPPERIDFDATNLPSGVLDALAEAVTCHANGAFVAAAIMVRKTLEELCRDRRASGDNLKERIKALRDSVILPPTLLDGLDELRLLGNDAAHVESRDYEDVGRAEVEAALRFTKEILKAAYQLSALLDDLRSLKKSP